MISDIIAKILGGLIVGFGFYMIYRSLFPKPIIISYGVQQTPQTPQKNIVKVFDVVDVEPVIAMPLQDCKPQQKVFNLQIINNALSIFLWGEQGSGKTTMIQYLCQKRIEMGHIVIVCDAHATFTDYPDGCKVVGKSRDYAAINDEFKAIIDDVNSRYAIGKSGKFHPVTVVVDELTQYRNRCSNLSEFMEIALSEFRKVKYHVIFAAHSNTAEILGTKGKHSITDGFIFINLKKDKQTGERFLIMKDGNERTEFLTPDLSDVTMSHSHDVTDNLNSDTPFYAPVTVCQRDNVTDFYESEIEKEIVKAYRKGDSLRTISGYAFRSINGRNTEKVKQILRKYGEIK